MPFVYGNYFDCRIELRVQAEDENLIFCVLLKNISEQHYGAAGNSVQILHRARKPEQQSLVVG
jgi:hypothetical protein